MSVTWNAKLISNLLAIHFAPKMASISTKAPPEASIDVLITFDPRGVSSHPNHKSLYAGAHAFIRALMHHHTGWECPVNMYTLTSTHVLRKYMAIFDAPATLLACVFTRRELGSYPTPLVFVGSVGAYRTAQLAMTAAHKSQMKWFRWGWISLSRYMVMNDLRKERTR